MVNLIIQDHSSILSSISLEKESYRTCSYFLSSRLSALPPGAVHTLLSIQVTDSLRSTVASGVMGWMCSVMYQILTSAYHNDFPSINENGTFIVGNEKKKTTTTNKQCIFLYGRPVKTDQSAHPHSLISLHCSREEASTRVLGTHRTPSDPGWRVIRGCTSFCVGLADVKVSENHVWSLNSVTRMLFSYTKKKKKKKCSGKACYLRLFWKCRFQGKW